jgi:hypothetical protein
MSIKTCDWTIKKAKGNSAARNFTTELVLSRSFPIWLYAKSIAEAFGKSLLILPRRSDIKNRL